MNRAAAANRLWRWHAGRDAARLDRALRDPEAAQRCLLERTLTGHCRTAFGRHLDLARVTDYRTFRGRVPLQSYDDLRPWIDRIRRGEPGVLTPDRVTHLVPTSGSTGAVKLIPFTAGLQRQFNAGIRPWIADLFTRHPAAMGGPAYWSISPALDVPQRPDDHVPIGFDDDAAYLGRVGQRLVRSVFAVPGDVRQLSDIDDFRFATLWWLVRSRSLRLVSVWHPSFWTLLTDGLPRWWSRLVEGLASGVCRGPSGRTLAGARPLRGADLQAVEAADPARPRTVWPDLAVVSAWADAAAAGPFGELAAAWPGVHLQPKGLISTEAMVSLPYGGTHPAAVTSHVIELLDDAGACHPLHRVEVGGRYEPVVTTAGGLCRYRTGDRVEVTGRLHRTPTLRFLGRGNTTSDLCGEKLSEAQVAEALIDVLRSCGVELGFAMLTASAAAAPTWYTLWLEPLDGSGVEMQRLASTLDERLQENPHYRWARRLGQLGPVRARPAPPDARHRLLQAAAAAGRTLGAVKPAALGGFAEHRALIGEAD